MAHRLQTEERCNCRKGKRNNRKNWLGRPKLSKNKNLKMQMAALILISIPCFAGGLGTPDTNCNPAVDPPVIGGCTWYNFYGFIADGSIHAGSSFTNYYVQASDPPWTITTTGNQVIRVLDGGHQGDTFQVFDNGVLLGETSPTSIDANHSCAGDPTGPGTDPAACWNDPLMSRGTFPLTAGPHSITLVWKQQVAGGNSSLQWFEIGNASTTTSNLTYLGSMPHIASEENWTTTFTLVNKGGTSAEANISAFADSGLPLPLPLTLVQSSSSSFIATSLDRTLNANSSLVVQSSGPANVPVLVGGAQVSVAGPVDGFAIFHRISDSQEAVVPLETRNASSYILPFDNTNGIVLGVAVENVSTQAANVNVVFRDDTGAPIGTGNISLPGSGHTSFVLSTQFPFVANLRGTAEFDTPVGGQISLLGIRFTGSMLTTIPVLANVGTSGGSIAHIAASNGWTTTFVLVNAGSVPAQANLNFFADDGTPLTLPLTFPQVGSAVSTSSTVSRTLAAGASLLVQSTGPVSSALLTGSAQLTTNGNVSGFVIFRYEPRGDEAVVPLENRNASAYLLAFDNTASTATGVAVNNASNAAVNIPVILRDDTGAQIGTGTIPLNPNGHSSFVLATQFPVTANIRGTIEFDTPVGATIGALGFRTPVALTFTTLPALAK